MSQPTSRWEVWPLFYAMPWYFAWWWQCSTFYTTLAMTELTRIPTDFPRVQRLLASDKDKSDLRSLASPGLKKAICQTFHLHNILYSSLLNVSNCWIVCLKRCLRMSGNHAIKRQVISRRTLMMFTLLHFAHSLWFQFSYSDISKNMAKKSLSLLLGSCFAFMTAV